MILEDFMPPKLLNNIVKDIGVNNAWEPARVYKGADGRRLLDKSKRSGLVAHLDESKWNNVRTFLWESTAKKLGEMCGLPFEGLTDIQLLKYEVGDYFLPHQDRGGPFSNALFTIVGGLVEPKEGGALQIYDPTQKSYKMNPGRIVAFPSDAFHESTPVEDGQKIVFVAWFIGNLTFRTK